MKILFSVLVFGIPAFAFGQSMTTEELNSEWTVSAGTCNSNATICALNAGTPISLWNNYIRNYVQYGERDYGINLVWARRGPTPVKDIRFMRASGTLDPVIHGEALALFVEGGKFLKYSEREYGINLVWSDTPVYEWKVEAGAPGGHDNSGDPGTRVNTRKPIGLVNTKIGQHVVYCEREYGINLRWAKDCKRAPKPKVVAAHMVSLRLNLSGSASSGQCASSGRVRFTMKPMTITAHVTSDDRVRPGLESERSTEVSWNNAGNQGCISSVTTYLAPGSWRINATNLIDWNTNCLVDLPVSERRGSTDVNFFLKQGGCRYQ
jgi:hypothetical protein